jgi:hypothetical protein
LPEVQFGAIALARFKGGRIFLVGVTVEKAQYLDLQKEAERVMKVQ